MILNEREKRWYRLGMVESCYAGHLDLFDITFSEVPLYIVQDTVINTVGGWDLKNLKSFIDLIDNPPTKYYSRLSDTIKILDHYQLNYIDNILSTAIQNDIYENVVWLTEKFYKEFEKRLGIINKEINYLHKKLDGIDEEIIKIEKFLKIGNKN